ARRHLATHVAAFLRDAPPRRRRRPAHRPGAARARRPGDHTDLHARLACAIAGCIPRRAPASPARGRRELGQPRRWPNVVTRRSSLARAGLIVTGAFLASRLLGWVRIVVFGATFGASPDLDNFFAAFRLPDLMFQLVAAGAMSAALVPIVSGLHANGEDARAWRVASTVMTLILAMLLVLAIVVALAAPVLIPAIVSFDAAGTERTIELTRIMLLSPILLAAAAVATSLLNAQGRFAASAVAPLVYNLAIIGAAIFLAPVLGVPGLALGVVIGA